MRRRGWHPQDIMAAVRKRGSNLQKLSREHGFARETFNRALTSRFPNAHKVIADYLGLRRRDLWPQWYDQNDEPIGRTRKDRSWRRAGRTIDIGEAA